ncbi:IclR family transcriptional regulator [Pollutimonas harenae]|uniref:Helix-turn-helix domain-containing protein n=1 Tax=Pollutimonas harenae TaxID=657015 RepID=A0A853GZJ0_9BURK|nr:helix-turn-helix domain-containing protein [Pollutimonas harenae]NYT85180.1 helix-turn-helix domain-containing protein [Pollutimonas harenae]TEA72442.1 IclR family transcriptional regulator [Pollutimonas harenae]
MDISSKGGTQSIRRVLHMLRLLAQHEASGLSLQEITSFSGLERSTAHRIITCLAAENFARKDTESKRYYLGIDAMQIGFSAMQRVPIADTLRPLAKRLCRLSEDTVFLVVQQGDYALCLLREHGDFPVRIFTIDAGEKRLMGIGAGGLALIADYSNEAIAKIYARHAVEYEQAGLPLDCLLQKVRHTRQQGFSEIVDGITPGVSGVGYSFSISKITKVAISFGAISQRLDAARRQTMGKLLAEECLAWVRAM